MESKTNTQSSLAKWVMELVDLDPSKLDNEKFQPRSSLDETALELVDKELERELGGQYEELSDWEKEAAKKDVVKKLVNRGLVEEDKELGLVKEEKPPSQPKEKIEIPDKLTWTIESLEFHPEPRPHVLLRRSILEDIPKVKGNLTEDLRIFLGGVSKDDELLKKLIVAKVLEEFPESQTIYEFYSVFFEFPEKERKKLDELVDQVIRDVRKYGDLLTPVWTGYGKITWVVLRGDEVLVFMHRHKWPKPVLRARLKINRSESEFFQVSDLEAMGYTIHAVTFTPSESDPVSVDITFPDGSRNLLYFESVDTLISYLKRDLDVDTVSESVFEMIDAARAEEKRYRESLGKESDS